MIEHVLDGIEGSINISDDVFVFGNDQRDHDEYLAQVLLSLIKHGLTVNLPKCLFNMSRLKFYGMIFSANGMEPDPKRVEALVKLSSPASSGEVHSLLGMVNYNAKM